MRIRCIEQRDEQLDEPDHDDSVHCMTKTPQLNRDWLSAKDACAYLEISWPTLKRWIKEGKLQASQPGGRKGSWRISASSIEKLLNR